MIEGEQILFWREDSASIPLLLASAATRRFRTDSVESRPLSLRNFAAEHGEDGVGGPMLLIALIAGNAVVQSEPIGSFHHGQWQGACFRDGFLSGQDDEVCRAHWAGDIDVTFDRNADGLTLFVAVANRAGRQCGKLLSFSPSDLAELGREAKLIVALDAGARTVAKRCAVGARLPIINAKDLRATLRETDGLTHLAL